MFHLTDIREIPIKTTRSQYAPVRTAQKSEILSTDNIKCSSPCGGTGILCTAGKKENGAATSEVSLVVCYKSKHTFTIQFNNHILAFSHQNVHIDIYRVLVIITKTWEQLKCPLVGKL
jgi:hypothetical protein